MKRPRTSASEEFLGGRLSRLFLLVSTMKHLRLLRDLRGDKISRFIYHLLSSI